jgi:hypothetical protein
MKVKILFLLLIVVFLSGCSKNSDWVGFYYPDKNDIGANSANSNWKIMPGFESVDACRAWINEVSVGNSNYDYECGKKCRREDNGLMICQETRR